MAHLPPLFPGATLPLLLQPGGDRRLDSLLTQLAAPDFQAQLSEAGAVLMRGWPIDDAAAFERVARAIEPELKNEYLGTSPRNALTPYVFTASELPPFFPIPQHCEMSFTKNPPRRLFFACLQPNRAPGGETPLVDMRQVWRDLPEELRARFSEKGIQNIRNYSGLKGGSWWDPWKLKKWDEMFGTRDQEAVTRRCAAEGFEAVWGKGGSLRLINRQSATKVHPATGATVWFNHAQVFHRDAIPHEYNRIATRLGPRYRAWSLFARFLLGLKRLVQTDDEVAMHATFGDGTEISAAEMEALREAIWKNMVAFPWEKGDVLAIDNDAVSHGRMPYAGPRLVAVAWA